MSNLTTILSVNNVVSSLLNYSDIVSLKGIRIFTFDTYLTNYIRHSDFAGNVDDIFVTFPRTKEGLQQLVQAFYNNGSSDNHVLLLDAPIVNNVHSKYPCSTRVLHETINHFNYGFIAKTNEQLTKINKNLF